MHKKQSKETIIFKTAYNTFITESCRARHALRYLGYAGYVGTLTLFITCMMVPLCTY